MNSTSSHYFSLLSAIFALAFAACTTAPTAKKKDDATGTTTETNGSGTQSETGGDTGSGTDTNDTDDDDDDNDDDETSTEDSTSTDTDTETPDPLAGFSKLGYFRPPTDKGERLFAATVDGDDRVIVGGEVWSSLSENSTMLMAFLPDGRLDETFGTDGYLRIDHENGGDEGDVRHLVSLSDGSLVAAVEAVTGNLLKLSASGMKQTFTTTGPGTYDQSRPVNAMLALAGGGLYVSRDNDRLAKLDNEMALVSAFGTNGVVNHDVGMKQIRLHDDGAVLLLPAFDSEIRRITSTGSDDDTFGGILDFEALSEDYGLDSAVMTVDGETGKIFVLGKEYQNPVWVPKLTRLTSAGLIDDTFGTDGYVTMPGSGVSWEAIGQQSTGRLIACGTKDDAAWTCVGMSTAGVVDTTFGNDGIFQADFGTELGTILVLSDDRIVLVGTAGSPDATSVYAHAAVLRLTAKGELDQH